VNNPEPSSFPRPAGTRYWELPPLILHPFSDNRGPELLVECSRAQLMLAGFLPMEGAVREELEQIVLRGRVCEVRMLFYVGLDIGRWLEQCVEVAARERAFGEMRLSRRSFAALLVGDAPVQVHEKLNAWGVSDYKALFGRAVGLNAVFGVAPDLESVQNGFLMDYHRYADALFRSWNEADEGIAATREAFTFDLYASGEYSRILERQWQLDSGGGAQTP
jgi:hypothetical protein